MIGHDNPAPNPWCKWFFVLDLQSVGAALEPVLPAEKFGWFKIRHRLWTGFRMALVEKGYQCLICGSCDRYEFQDDAMKLNWVHLHSRWTLVSMTALWWLTDAEAFIISSVCINSQVSVDAGSVNLVYIHFFIDSKPRRTLRIKCTDMPIHPPPLLFTSWSVFKLHRGFFGGRGGGGCIKSKVYISN